MTCTMGAMMVWPRSDRPTNTLRVFGFHRKTSTSILRKNRAPDWKRERQRERQREAEREAERGKERQRERQRESDHALGYTH